MSHFPEEEEILSSERGVAGRDGRGRLFDGGDVAVSDCSTDLRKRVAMDLSI